VAKRPRFSRWRRLPPVFRSGEHRPVGTGNELDRIILYLPIRILDLAEALAEKAGIPAVQEYCSQLLARALEAERIQQKVADFEARRGPLEGLKAIAADPDYLAEWQARSEPRPEPPAAGGLELDATPGHSSSIRTGSIETVTVDLVLADGDNPAMGPSSAGDTRPSDEAAPAGEPSAPPPDSATDPVPDSDPVSIPVPVPTAQPAVRVAADRSALEVIWRHVGLGEDELAFLPCLRRGAPVPAARAAELIRALTQLELEHRGAEVLDRRLAHALHRLALESQVLLTDAWPDVFDERVITTIRSVQEAVERILSGQDIRYYPTDSQPAWEPPR
jgi:hypothetical protein